MVTRLEMQEYDAEVEDSVYDYMESETHYVTEVWDGNEVLVRRCRQCPQYLSYDREIIPSPVRQHEHAAECNIGKLRAMVFDQVNSASLSTEIIAAAMAEIHALQQLVPEESETARNLDNIYRRYESSLTTPVSAE